MKIPRRRSHVGQPGIYTYSRQASTIVSFLTPIEIYQISDSKKERWVNVFPKSHSDIAAAENRLDLSLAASSDHSQSANLWIIFYSTKFPLKNEWKNDL